MQVDSNQSDATVWNLILEKKIESTLCAVAVKASTPIESISAIEKIEHLTQLRTVLRSLLNLSSANKLDLDTLG